MNAGRLDALIEAFILSAGNGWPLPQWAFEPVLALLNAAYAAPAKGKPGRAAKQTATADEMNNVHVVRWSVAVMWLARRKVPECRSYFARGGHKPTEEGAFAMASKMLQGKPAQAGPDTIEKSYKLVKKAIKNGTAARFGLTCDETGVTY